MRLTTRYFPHVDGLRAVAVLAVIVYHLGIVDLSGGFIGVDIFFVISGYLITKNIVALQAQNRFRLSTFYEARARRLFPTLLLVLCATTFFIWDLLLSEELVDYSLSLLSAIFFGSNIWFYFEDSYHAAESARKALLHTWSLGVEEQFYLLFPFLLIVLWQFKQRTKLSILMALAVVSLLLAQYLTTANAEFGFYLLPTRVWEFIAGALLVFVPSNVAFRRQLVIELWVIAAMIAIAVSFYHFSATTAHPSLITLIPVLGAAALIFFGAQSRFAAVVLSNPLSVWVGKLSYSLYLWHFPIVAVFTILNPEEIVDGSDRVKMLLLTFSLAIVSHYLIEKPLRYGGRRGFVLFVVVTLLSLLTFSAHVLRTEGMAHRLGVVNKIFEGTQRADANMLVDGKPCLISRTGTGCRFESFDGAKKIINIGDSHAMVMNNALRDMASANALNFESMILSHCPYIKDAWRITGFKAKCTLEMQAQVRAYLLSQPPAIITYIVRFPYYLNVDNFDNGEGGVEYSSYLPFYPNPELDESGVSVETLIKITIEELAAHGHKVVLVYPVPEVGWHVPNLVKSKIEHPRLAKQLQKFQDLNVTTNYDVYLKRSAQTKRILDRIDHSNVVRIFPDQVFCSKSTGRCRTHDHKNLFYMDDDHLSQTGTAMLTQEIERALF